MNGFVVVYGGADQANQDTSLDRLASALRLRYPDSAGRAQAANVRMLFAGFSTVNDVRDFPQPHATHDGCLLVADARLVGRGELRRQLTQANLPADAADAEYILAAYRQWGRDCLRHLRGDFAFALWDGESLFVAHDHFALIPIYYARIGDAWIVSNDQRAILDYPGFDDALNDQFIADFLLFGMNYSTETTAYRHMQRLKPCHALAISADGIRTWPYYEPPPAEIDRRRDKQATLMQFRDLFHTAVRERLRWPTAATHLSGGMDSSSIAAVAAQWLGPENVRGYNTFYKELFPDSERELAAQIGEHLGISITHYDAESVLRRQPPDQPSMDFPEPVLIPENSTEMLIHRHASSHSRLLLTGFGGDPLLSYAGRGWDLADVWLAWPRLVQRGVSRLARGLKRIPRPSPEMPLSAHLAQAPFAQEYPLAERWREAQHPTHMDLRTGMLYHPLWSNIFAWSTRPFQPAPVRLSFPFFDLRLLEFVQSVPPQFWLYQKHILREAMRDQLPRSVIQRPKTPLPLAYPRLFLKKIGIQPWQRALLTSEIAGYYVDEKRLQACVLSDSADLFHLQFRQIINPYVYLYWYTTRK